MVNRVRYTVVCPEHLISFANTFAVSIGLSLYDGMSFTSTSWCDLNKREYSACSFLSSPTLMPFHLFSRPQGHNKTYVDLLEDIIVYDPEYLVENKILVFTAVDPFPSLHTVGLQQITHITYEEEGVL